MTTTIYKRSLRYLAVISLIAIAVVAMVAIVAFSYDFGDSAVTEAEPTFTKVSLTATPKESSGPDLRQATNVAKSLSLAFRFAAEKALPAVVTIENRLKPTLSRHPSRGRNPSGGNLFDDGSGQPSERAIGLGSGFIINSSGLIMTNNHVVAGNGDVVVRLHDGREFIAEEIWTDPLTDIAVVKIDGGDLDAAELGDSDNVDVGDWVIALGQPFGLDDTVTAGIISGKHRGIGIAAREYFLQTDAAINPGNSGGPLVNLDGQVIGMNTAISSRSGGNEGIGFAVPINLAKWVGEQLAEGGVVHRAYLGVSVQPVSASVAQRLQIKPREGVFVTEVFADTPAAMAGLMNGDVIVQFAGVDVNSPQQLQLLAERVEFGKPQPMIVFREGLRKELKFTPQERPDQFGGASERKTTIPRLTPRQS